MSLALDRASCGSPMSRVAVLGAGAWGTALALHAARQGHAVTLWARSAPRAALPAELLVVQDPAAAVAGADFAIVAVPAQHLRAVMAGLPGLPLLLACKGFEAGTGLLPTEVLGHGAVLSGPNFAGEVAAGLPAAAVVAGAEAGLREMVIAALGGPTLRLYSSEDVLGVQASGAVKNVLAIAAGAAMGAGLGENARAALITRGLAELSRLVLALGGRAETAAGLSGMGDLMLTASSPTSRNTALGMRLGQGETLGQALAASRGVAEGVATAPALLARAARLGVEMPICAAVAAMLDGQVSVREAMGGLLARPVRPE